MKTNNTFPVSKTLIVGALISSLGLTTFFVGVNTSNQEIELRVRGEAQQKRMELTYDTTWKILKQQAGVSEKYSEQFKEIYPKIMEARYGEDKSGGSLFNFVSESNPQFDSSLYGKLVDSIEAQQESFLQAQVMAADIKREHTALLHKFPSSLILSGRPELKFNFVTSAKTEETFATGKDDNVELFEEKK